MLFKLRFDKNKRAFKLSNGQYEYSNIVNDEIVKSTTFSEYIICAFISNLNPIFHA
jgi:hypothetical protein